MPKKLSARLHNLPFKQIGVLLVVTGVAVIGAYLIVGSHAAGPYASITADSGTPAAGAVKQTCAGAADGNCVAFKGSGGGGTQTTNCIPSPKLCGYPDPTATSGSSVVGPVDGNGNSVACSSLTPSGSITTSSNGQTITGMNITGFVLITKSNVTLNNDCITSTGGGKTCTNSTGAGSSHACFPLWVQSGSVTISNTTIGGTDNDANSIIGIADTASANSGTLDHVYVHDCTECGWGTWVITNSYITSDGVYDGTTNHNTAHPEDFYLSDQSFTANHDTFISGVPSNTDAVFFGDTNGGSGGACSNQWTVKNSLLTVMNNGNAILGTCSNSSSAGPSALLDFENNDFGPGGNCPGGIVWDNNCGQKAGNFGAWCSALGSRLTWTGNFRDSNGATVYCSPSGNAPTGP